MIGQPKGWKFCIDAAFRTNKNFKWCKPWLSWCWTVKINSHLNSVLPKWLLYYLRPMNHGMNKHGTCLFGDSYDVVFCYAILMVSINATKTNLLSLLYTCFFEEFSRKDSIICMIFLDWTMKTIEAKNSNCCLAETASLAPSDIWGVKCNIWLAWSTNKVPTW